MPNNELVSFFQELAEIINWLALYGLLFVLPPTIAPVYRLLNKREANWSQHAPAIVSGIVTGELAVQLLANFFPVPINNPRSLCDS